MLSVLQPRFASSLWNTAVCAAVTVLSSCCEDNSAVHAASSTVTGFSGVTTYARGNSCVACLMLVHPVVSVHANTLCAIHLGRKRRSPDMVIACVQQCDLCCLLHHAGSYDGCRAMSSCRDKRSRQSQLVNCDMFSQHLQSVMHYP